MKPTIKVKTGGPGAGPILSGLRNLERRQVYVGISENSSSRRSKGDKINNAELAYIHTQGVHRPEVRAALKATKLPYEKALALYLHTFGSPVMGIPPRPIIEPAILADGNHQRIEKELKLAAQAALDGNDETSNRFLRRAGMLAVTIVKAWFVDPRNHWAPNAPSTVKRKKSSQPLIYTGQLRNSITFVVTE